MFILRVFFHHCRVLFVGKIKTAFIDKINLTREKRERKRERERESNEMKIFSLQFP